ncbi:hypothetical protein [Hyphomicrobium sp. 1Nfss2.1]|uniref:hypothetical protein n=1 Tax=Hyphomicrobium sp. 1Nfss2.1 TaxID=3413936 RepID=UPI003C7E9979
MDYKMLREAIEDAEDIRNVLAHCAWLWLDDEQAWAVQIARGSWSNVPRSDRARRSKRIFPEGQLLRAQTLKSYVKGIDGIIGHLRQLQSAVENQLLARHNS